MLGSVYRESLSIRFECYSSRWLPILLGGMVPRRGGIVRAIRKVSVVLSSYCTISKLSHLIIRVMLFFITLHAYILKN